MQEFYTITNLQGSQTIARGGDAVGSFTPLQTYKVLKLPSVSPPITKRFTPLQTYKVLKPIAKPYFRRICFTPLQTYKVLKLHLVYNQLYNCFTPLQTYKVLKPL